jgi:hypothetical protein
VQLLRRRRAGAWGPCMAVPRRSSSCALYPAAHREVVPVAAVAGASAARGRQPAMPSAVGGGRGQAPACLLARRGGHSVTWGRPAGFRRPGDRGGRLRAAGWGWGRRQSRGRGLQRKPPGPPPAPRTKGCRLPPLRSCRGLGEVAMARRLSARRAMPHPLDTQRGCESPEGRGAAGAAGSRGCGLAVALWAPGRHPPAQLWAQMALPRAPHVGPPTSSPNRMPPQTGTSTQPPHHPNPLLPPRKGPFGPGARPQRAPKPTTHGPDEEGAQGRGARFTLVRTVPDMPHAHTPLRRS